jgi:hypothetical protein
MEEAVVWNVGTFGVDADGEATSGYNHEGESTDATPRDGTPTWEGLGVKLPGAIRPELMAFQSSEETDKQVPSRNLPDQFCSSKRPREKKRMQLKKVNSQDQRLEQVKTDGC